MHNYPSQVLQVHIKTIISHKICNFLRKKSLKMEKRFDKEGRIDQKYSITIDWVSSLVWNLNFCTKIHLLT